MSDTLKRKILNYIETQNVSVTGFERESSLNRNTIQGILSGKTDKPTIDTIIKIADKLDCTLDELLGRELYSFELDQVIEASLIESTLACIQDYIKTENIKEIKLKALYFSLRDITKYCLDNNFNTCNASFAKWYLKNTLNKK